MPYTITRAQRDALRAEAIAELGEIDTIYLALSNDDFALARRQRGHFEPFMRLLDDLGWELDDARTSFEITMPEVHLAQLADQISHLALGRLDGLAVRALDQSHDAEEARALIALAGVCGELLAQIALAAAGAVAVTQAMEA